MKKNMGTRDKTIRAFLAITIAILYFTGVIAGTEAIVLMIISAVFLLTSFIGFCPIYMLIGARTIKKTEPTQNHFNNQNK